MSTVHVENQQPDCSFTFSCEWYDIPLGLLPMLKSHILIIETEPSEVLCVCVCMCACVCVCVCTCVCARTKPRSVIIWLCVVWARD